MQELTLTLYVYDEKQEKIVNLSFDKNQQIIHKEFRIWENLLPLIKQIASSLNLKISYKKITSDKPQIILLFTKSKNLADARFFDSFAKNKVLRPLINPKERYNNILNRTLYHPIITIGYTDIFHLHSEDKDSPEQEGWNSFIYKMLDLDKRFKFLDSSIWHRYVPIFPFQETFEDVFKKVLTDIVSYTQQGLYYTNAAIISLEFQIRMLLHSYVAKFGSKGHSEVVTPFKFHSEWQMHKRAKEEIDFLQKNWGNGSLLETLKWRMLIVDDQARGSLSFIKDELKDIYQLSKEKLIKKPLQELYQEKGIDVEQQLKVDAFDKEHDIISFAIKHISENTYDIIFLDYLLGNNTKEGKREYGHDLLLKLLSDNRDFKPKYRRDFLGKYWIFPISSYPYALLDKLSQLGISHLHEIWHISQGGDPVSTPNLYAFNLYRFIKQKIGNYFLYPNALRRFFNQISIPSEDLYWTSLLKQSIENGEKRLEILETYEENSSLFIESMKIFLRKKKNNIYIDCILKAVRTTLDELNKGISRRDDEAIRQYLSIDYLFPSSLFTEGSENVSIVREEYYKSLNSFIERVNSILDEPFLKAKKEIEIAISKNGNQLNINSFNLKKLPPSIEHASRITLIQLSDNYFSEFPPVLFKLETLERIYLNKNNIRALIPNGWQQLPNLEYLNLQDNPLKLSFYVAHTRDQVIKLWNEASSQKSLIDWSSERSTLRALLANGKKEETINRLEMIGNDLGDKQFSNIRISLSSQMSELNKKFLNGLINNEEYSNEINRITLALLNVIDEYL